MRRVLLLGLLAGVAACGSDATGPGGPAIEVQVVDDRGVPVDRIRIVVTLSPTEKVRMLTGKTGIARFRIPEAGSYQVSVIPRAGYLTAPGTSRATVVVSDDLTADVGFTVHRESYQPPPPEREAF